METRPQSRGGRGTLELVDLLDFAIGQVNDGIAIMRFTDDANVPIRIVYANRAIERLSGYTREELLDPSNPFLRVQPQNRARYEELFGEVRAGRPVRFEIELGGKDRKTWTEIRWSPLRYKDEEVTHYVAVLRDTSERRRVQRERDLLYHVIEQTSDFIVTADATRLSEGGPKITYANAAFCALVGLEPEQVVGKGFIEFLSPRNERASRASVLSRLDRQADISIELQLRDFQSDSDRWIELSGHQFRGEGGRVASWIFIGKDIRLRKQSYTQTAQLMTALDLADEPIAIYDLLGPLEFVLQHMNERAVGLDEPLLDRMLREPHQRARIESAWPALEGGKAVHRLVRVPESDPRRWVTLELRPLLMGNGPLASIVAIEHELRFAMPQDEPDDIGIALALSREILAYHDLEARRDAFLEALAVEWGARGAFSSTQREVDVVLRARERNGYAVMPRGAFFDRTVAVDMAWTHDLAPRRLTSLRILLETLARTD